MSLEACLPANLQGPSTSITRLAVGLSGAGVYRVDAAGQPFVLKVSSGDEPLANWHRTVHLQQLAANAGLAPTVVHTDEAQRAVLSAFVVNRSFPAFYATPSTREAALTLLGRTLRRVHQLPLPPDTEPKDTRAFLAGLWSTLEASCKLPPFTADAVHRVLTEQPPPSERALVLSHNDVNPTNLAYDGEKLMLLDWETCGPNDPFVDLAAISVFLRMDEASCVSLLTAYEGAAVMRLPARFGYNRRLVAALCGALFLQVAVRNGHAGAVGETLDATPSLAENQQRMRGGALNVATADGQWAFGLSLLKYSLAL